jgi:hypothetical protein
MMKACFFAVCAIALTHPVAAGATAPARTPWQTLEALQGSWRLPAPRTDGERAFRISYRPISKGSALVETFGNPAGSVTETIYHRDGVKIMATHYCAQGNQPRLVLEPAAARDALSFRFLDVTNLAGKDASHLIRIDFRLIGPNRLERRETYAEEGSTEESILVLEREAEGLDRIK